jgi:hypothetical protein
MEDVEFTRTLGGTPLFPRGAALGWRWDGSHQNAADMAQWATAIGGYGTIDEMRYHEARSTRRGMQEPFVIVGIGDNSVEMQRGDWLIRLAGEIWTIMKNDTVMRFFTRESILQIMEGHRE